MNNPPEISIILPVFNPAPHIDLICESLEAQTFKDFELILINDDHTKVFDKLVLQITPISLEMGFKLKIATSAARASGPALARNIGMDIAEGLTYAFFDCDDFWSKNFLLHMHWQLSQTSSDIVVCASTVVTQHRRVSLKLPSHYGREQLLQTNILSMPCVIIRAKSFELKRFLNIGHEDYHFWLSNVTDDIKITVLDEPLVTIFKSKNSVSSNLFRSAYWHWLILKEQKLSTPKRICYFLIYLLNALNKRWRFIGRIISL